MNFFSHLRCSSCNQTCLPDLPRTVCPLCGKALLAEYDLDEAKKRLSPDGFRNREASLWRYQELLPVRDDQPRVSLGEGFTPIIKTPRLGREFGLENLSIKEEGYNPTGSFKARGLSVAVSMAKAFGIRDVCIPSAGNAGGALAAYAARAGMKARVFVPADTPVLNIREVSLAGAEITLVDGAISDAAKKMNEMREAEWFDMSTMKEPYRLEGKKTMGYE